MIRSREARQRASQVLQMVGITTPPVDVERIATFLGFTVIPFDFPDAVSGLTFIEEGVKSIGVNAGQARVRQRFSIAHELGHYLSGHEAYDESRIRVEGQPDYVNAHGRQEIEANEFASELLMPRQMLERDILRAGELDVPVLAKRYQVSEQAMWIQLMDHKLASKYAKSSGS
ncbi:MAG: ImmA/IrrE family metallo-endopeptidase [Thermomicrobiales bacterium]